MNHTGAWEGAQAKAVIADLLVTETHDDLEVTLGLVQREPWEDLGRGNDQPWTSPMCVGLLQMANPVCVR